MAFFLLHHQLVAQAQAPLSSGPAAERGQVSGRGWLFYDAILDISKFNR